VESSIKSSRLTLRANYSSHIATAQLKSRKPSNINIGSQEYELKEIVNNIIGKKSIVPLNEKQLPEQLNLLK
jgi:hypothetical protein